MAKMDWDKVGREHRLTRGDDAGDAWSLDAPEFQIERPQSSRSNGDPASAARRGGEAPVAHKPSEPVAQAPGHWVTRCPCGWEAVGKHDAVVEDRSAHLRSAQLMTGEAVASWAGHESRELRRLERGSWLVICDCGAEFGPAKQVKARRLWVKHQADHARPDV